jgi:hypothetical protein
LNIDLGINNERQYYKIGWYSVWVGRYLWDGGEKEMKEREYG